MIKSVACSILSLSSVCEFSAGERGNGVKGQEGKEGGTMLYKNMNVKALGILVLILILLLKSHIKRA